MIYEKLLDRKRIKLHEVDEISASWGATYTLYTDITEKNFYVNVDDNTEKVQELCENVDIETAKENFKNYMIELEEEIEDQLC